MTEIGTEEQVEVAGQRKFGGCDIGKIFKQKFLREIV